MTWQEALMQFQYPVIILGPTFVLWAVIQRFPSVAAWNDWTKRGVIFALSVAFAVGFVRFTGSISADVVNAAVVALQGVLSTATSTLVFRAAKTQPGNS